MLVAARCADSSPLASRQVTNAELPSTCTLGSRQRMFQSAAWFKICSQLCMTASRPDSSGAPGCKHATFVCWAQSLAIA